MNSLNEKPTSKNIRTPKVETARSSPASPQSFAAAQAATNCTTPYIFFHLLRLSASSCNTCTLLTSYKWEQLALPMASFQIIRQVYTRRVRWPSKDGRWTDRFCPSTISENLAMKLPPILRNFFYFHVFDLGCTRHSSITHTKWQLLIEQLCTRILKFSCCKACSHFSSSIWQDRNQRWHQGSEHIQG